MKNACFRNTLSEIDILNLFSLNTSTKRRRKYLISNLNYHTPKPELSYSEILLNKSV